MFIELDPDASSFLEWSAVALNIGFTILIALHKRVGWLLGLVAAVIGVLLYAVEDAWLMSALNAFYAAMGVYGWWSWGRGEGEQRIIRYTWPKHGFFLLLGLAATGLLAWAMGYWQVPGELHGMEAFIAAFAIVATWQMSERALSNWVYWTIGDVVAVAYNHWIGYNGYALLNMVYVALAIAGLLRWRKQLREQEAAANVRLASW